MQFTCCWLQQIFIVINRQGDEYAPNRIVFNSSACFFCRQRRPFAISLPLPVCSQIRSTDLQFIYIFCSTVDYNRWDSDLGFHQKDTCPRDSVSDTEITWLNSSLTGHTRTLRNVFVSSIFLSYRSLAGHGLYPYSFFIAIIRVNLHSYCLVVLENYTLCLWPLSNWLILGLALRLSKLGVSSEFIDRLKIRILYG